MTFLLHIARYLTAAVYGAAVWSGRNRRNNGSNAPVDFTVGGVDGSGKGELGNEKPHPERGAASNEPYELEDDYWKEAMSRTATADKGKR
jgi:hypothetical protein